MDTINIGNDKQIDSKVARNSSSSIVKMKTLLNVDRCNLNFQSRKEIKNDDVEEEVFQYEPLYACYHLKNEIKSGLLSCNSLQYKVSRSNNSIINTKVELKENIKASDPLAYGILDFKQVPNLQMIESKKDLIYTANSDGSISLFSNNPYSITLQSNILINKENCTNVLDAYESKSLAIGLNNGEYALFDLETNKITTLSSKVHEYGIWAIKMISSNELLTGADDNTILLHDLREKKAGGSYKEHTAGITHINRLLNKEYEYVTGSYDESVSIFDVRNMKKSLFRKKLDVSVWDVKQVQYKEGGSEKCLLAMSSIYEGLNIYDFNVSEYDLNLRFEFKEHESIVYGIDTYLASDNRLLITSCSLYDNLISYWDYVI